MCLCYVGPSLLRPTRSGLLNIYNNYGGRKEQEEEPILSVHGFNVRVDRQKMRVGYVRIRLGMCR